MLKKIFNPKRKRQEPGRHNTSKITMDPVSTAILSRHFSPLSSRAKSPSDLLDIVGYPFMSNQFSRSSPELILYSTPLQLTDNNEQREEEVTNRRLTIRNNSTPSPIPPSHHTTTTTTNHDLQLLETSREDKTLVEEEKRKEQEELLLDETKREMYRLHNKLLDFEHERKVWKQKLQEYIHREEQMRQIIHENQAQIHQLKRMYHQQHSAPSRHNSYRTVSTHSSSWPTDDDDDEDEDDDRVMIEEGNPYIYYNYPQQHNLKRRYSSYYTNGYYNPRPYYY
ncbi:unnamed protein product [Mucor hiemalis]